MRYVSKQFLSPCAHESGSMICSIETPRVKDLGMYSRLKDTISPNMSADVTFRACSGEPVTLDLSAHSERDFEKRLAKITLMINELSTMRGQMAEMWASHIRDVEFKNKQKESEQK